MTARYLVGKYNLCRIGRISKFNIELGVAVNIRKMVKFPLMGNWKNLQLKILNMFSKLTQVIIIDFLLA